MQNSFEAMDANNVNVSELSNSELGTLLRQYGAECGPIIGKYHWNLI